MRARSIISSPSRLALGALLLMATMQSLPACSLYHPLSSIFPGEELEEDNPGLLLLALLGITPTLSVTEDLQLRLRPDLESVGLADGRIATLANTGALGGIALQTTTALRPAYSASEPGLGGRPAMLFEGDPNTAATGNLLSYPGLGIQRMTFATVFYSSPGAATTRLVYEHDTSVLAGDGMYLNTHDNDSVAFRRGAPGALATTQTSRDVSANWANDGVARVVVHVYDGSHASHRLFLNGAEPTYGVTTFTIDVDALLTADLYLGGRVGDSLYLSGAIGEVLFYNRALRAAEREAVECYFSQYYSIAIAHGC